MYLYLSIINIGLSYIILNIVLITGSCIGIGRYKKYNNNLI